MLAPEQHVFLGTAGPSDVNGAAVLRFVDGLVRDLSCRAQERVTGLLRHRWENVGEKALHTLVYREPLRADELTVLSCGAHG